jgi:putative tricarboxylic transport membrane protein
MTTVYTATERRPNGAAFIVAAGLAALGSVMIWQAGTIPDKGGYAGIGSGDVPRFVGYGLLLLAIAHVVTGLRHGRTGKIFLELTPVLWVVAGLALQLVLLKPLGFGIASGLLFALTAAGFGKRNLILTIPIGIALSLLIYGVFDQLLKLKLPAGFLENLIFGG